MKTWLIAVALLCTSLLAAQDENFDKVQIKVHPVSGSVYMLEGEGGNIGVSVGEDGIVIVDDEFAPLAPKIKTALKGISDKPIRFVLNTHWHGDHVGGNAQFGADAPIIAQENVRERMKNGSSIAGQEVPPAKKEALPIVTFNDRATVHLNGEDIRAMHFPSGHTDGDSIIYFTKSDVVHMGDDFVRYGFPFVDLKSGGSVEDMLAAVDKIIATFPGDTKVIPGH
ncbi:MAG TPA: MBL fold metallo-hydrolase, partial [Terriglobales bacterium]|nr:MBL fold metallo-hydrolase [Terriglobales bacterium]